MTNTIDAPSPALDLRAPLDVPSAVLAPPALARPNTAVPPPPITAPSALALPPLALAPTAPVAPIAPAFPPAPLEPTAVASSLAAPEPGAPSAPPAMTTGPSGIFSADAPVIPLEPAVPMLPTNTPVVPSAAPAATAGAAFNVEEFLGAPTPSRKAPAKSGGRWIVRLLMVGLLAAGGWAAKQYGPDLYEQYVTDKEETGPAEATAPLAFPNVPAESAPIRTAEFVLVGLPETPGATYRVTTDFETSVSQVDITRTNGPDLQILTYGSDAMIRRADGEQWYLLDRGQFPLDGRLERSDWVRRLDELLPSAIRDQTTINESTESTMSGVPTRRLAITVDRALLDSTGINAAPTPIDPAIDPAADGAILAEEPLATDAATPVTATPGPGPVSTTGPIEIQIWVDGDGLIRQVSGAPQLGAEMITVVRTSADAWIPEYPEPSEIATLTASALIDLGL